MESAMLGETGNPTQVMSENEQFDEKLAEQFSDLAYERDENGQVATAVAVLNIGQNEAGWNGRKCDVPVVRLHANEIVSVSVENGQEIFSIDFGKNPSRTEITQVLLEMQGSQNELRQDFDLAAFTRSLTEILTKDLGAEANVTNSRRKEYLPYNEEDEINEDNLKSIEWLVEQYRERIEKPVDQGSERLLDVEVGGINFDLLESGDMYFLLNNTPTIELMDAAIREGLITEEDKSNYISLQEEAQKIQETKNKYGQGKDLRKDDFWANAPANYEFDAARRLNYLDIGGEPVMDEFERDYIQLLGANVSRYDSAVLEVGFGMGISANAVQKKLQEVSSQKLDEPSAHVIIELNHEVAEKAREWAKRQKIPVVILEGDWVKEIKKIPDNILTASLADPYPLNSDEKHKDAALALGEIYKKLRPGGVASYYPDSQYCLSPMHAEIAEKAGFPWIGSLTSRFAEEGKNTGEYYDPRLRMAVPVLYKEGGTGSSEVNKIAMSGEQKRELIQRIFIENPHRARELLLSKPI